MTLPHTPYAATTNPQMSYLDDTFAAVGALTIISCTATGTNAYTITPQTNAPSVSAYANYTVFSFIVPNSSTGLVTIQVGALASLPAYDIDGTTQLTTGDLVQGRYFACAYNLALNSGNGGFVRVTPNTVQAPLPSKIAQVVTVQNGIYATGSATFPVTSATVISGAGTQFMVLTMTPSSAASNLRIDVAFAASLSASQNGAFAVFRDSAATCAGVTLFPAPSAADFPFSAYMTTFVSTASTAVTTFRVRAGCNGGATVYFNGNSGGGFFSGAMQSRITVTELLP